MSRSLPILIAFLAACGDANVSTVSPTDAGSPPDQSPTADVRVADMAGAIPDARAPLTALRDDALASPSWREKVQRVLDSQALGAFLSDRAYALPAGSAIYAVRVSDGAQHAAFEFFDGGDGAFDMSFWPASTIKLLSTLAALEWVYLQGHTGAAQVDWDSGFGDQLRAIYTRAITVSSNIDYDRTLRAAGWDYTNAEFLTDERGFPRTVITSSYASVEVRNPGGYTLSEDGQSTYVAGRPGTGEYGRNDTDLYELVEGVRRVMLNDELPEEERFRVDPADISAVQQALCTATPSFFADGAATAFGSAPIICHKPGWVPDNECLDFGFILAPDESRYLIAASVPYATNCPQLSTVAEHMIDFLAQAPGRVPLQHDVGEVTIQVEAPRVSVDIPGADEAALWDGPTFVDRVPGDRGRFVFDHAVATPEPLLSVVGYAGGAVVAFRSVTVVTP